jgi:hypothetical protein
MRGALAALKKQQALLGEWAHVPEGTKVLYRKTTSSIWLPGTTASAPFLIGNHTACIMLEEVSGAFSLEFVRK